MLKPLHRLSQSSSRLYEVGANVIHILPTRKLRHREGKELVQSHTAKKQSEEGLTQWSGASPVLYTSKDAVIPPFTKGEIEGQDQQPRVASIVFQSPGAVPPSPQPRLSLEEATSGLGQGGPRWPSSSSDQRGRQAWCSDHMIQRGQGPERLNHIQGHTSRVTAGFSPPRHPAMGRGAPGHCPLMFSGKFPKPHFL